MKRIFVRSTTNYSIEVSDTPTLSEVQQKVQNKEGITCNLQHILYKGSTLSEETAVGLQNEDNIHVLVKGKGGMREIFKSKGKKYLSFQVAKSCLMYFYAPAILNGGTYSINAVLTYVRTSCPSRRKMVYVHYLLKKILYWIHIL